MFLPEKIKWFTNLDLDNPGFGIYSSKKIRGIKKSLERLKDTEYEYRFENVDGLFLDKFIPVYEGFINRIGGLVRDVRSTLSKENSQFNAITLYKSNEMVGALTYRKIDDYNINGYKCFPGKIKDLSLPQSPSNIGEYLFIRESAKDKIERVSWGTDRNYYGYGASIGLAKHKLELKGLPYIADEIIEKSDFEWKKDKDVLTFEFESKDSKIHATKANLFLTGENIDEKLSNFKIVTENTKFKTQIILE